MTVCGVCHKDVPSGEYCGACGAYLPTLSGRRPGTFAADPAQHVLQPDVISALLPHLPHRHSTPFRLGLLVLAAVLVALGILRLTGPAVIVAAAGVPILYLVYLHEVEVYEDNAALVIGLTLGVGLVLGLLWGAITGSVVTRAVLHFAAYGKWDSQVLTAAVVLPLLAQILMLVGPVILFLVGRKYTALDSFTFGAASALGFSFGSTLVELAPQLHHGLQSGGPAITNALMIAARGLLVPFLVASTTGLINAALWLRPRQTRTVQLGWIVSLPAAVLVAAVVRVIEGVVDVSITRMGVVVAIYALLSAALLLWVRLSLHSALLADAGDETVGPMEVCANCHHVVPRMPFCPHCGIAMAATPKRRVADGAALENAEPSAPYSLADQDVLRQLRRGRHLPRWGAAIGTLVVAAIALAVATVIAAPSRAGACGARCVSPPPPCLGFCRHASPAPPLHSQKTYTSSAYHFSVDYSQFAPSHQDSSSVTWTLSSSQGQYEVDVLGGKANNHTPQQLVDNLISNNFPDFTLLYQPPGVAVGYASGAGAVYGGQSAPLTGSASDTRVVVFMAVQKGLALSVVGAGDASTGGSNQPDPSELPVSSFVDDLAASTRWPGQTPR